MDLVLNQLQNRTQKALNIMTSLLGIIVCFILVLYGTQATLDHFVRGVPVIKYLEVPKFILLAIIPVGSFFLAFQFLLRIQRSLANLKKDAIQEEREAPQTGL